MQAHIAHRDVQYLVGEHTRLEHWTVDLTGAMYYANRAAHAYGKVVMVREVAIDILANGEWREHFGKVLHTALPDD